MAIFGIGINLWAELSVFLTPLAMFLTFQTQFIPLEEKQMEKEFGKEYKNYKERVRKVVVKGK